MEKKLTLKERQQPLTLTSAANADTKTDTVRPKPIDVKGSPQGDVVTNAEKESVPTADKLQHASGAKVGTGDADVELYLRSVLAVSSEKRKVAASQAAVASKQPLAWSEVPESTVILSPTMGGHRSGSSSSSIAWVGEGEKQRRRRRSSERSTEDPRAPAKRDSGYNTEGQSPAFPPHAHLSVQSPFFTFDTPFASPPRSETSSSLTTSPLRLPSPLSPVGFPPRRTPKPITSSTSRQRRGDVRPEAAEVDSGDEDLDSDNADDDDDDPFISDRVSAGAASQGFSGLSAVSRSLPQFCPPPRARSRYSTGDIDDETEVGRQEADWREDEQSPEAGRQPGARGRSRRARHHSESSATTPQTPIALPGPVLAYTPYLSLSLQASPRYPASRPLPMDGRSAEVCGQDEVVAQRLQEVEQEDSVAATGYRLGPYSLVTLPGGGRLRPLLSRTIATQTPHQHCQLIDQIIECPQEMPQCARGSAVRRLRYYSEGEETVGGSLPIAGVGPLPDIVPILPGYRERSLSSPDIQNLRRQQQRARGIGRELRRISDEFQRSHEERRLGRGRGGGGGEGGGEEGNDRPFFPLHHHLHANAALVALHAEMNSVAAFFLSSFRRLLSPDLLGYFRYLFHVTRQVTASPGELLPLPLHSISSPATTADQLR